MATTIKMNENLSEEDKNLLLFADEEEMTVHNGVDNPDDTEEPPADPPQVSQSANTTDNDDADKEKNKTVVSTNTQTTDDDDIDEEQLLKNLNITKPNETSAEPTEFNNAVEVAGFLGFKFDDKKPEEVKLADIKAEVDKYKALASDDAVPEIKMMKTWLLENKDKTPQNFFEENISPFAPLMMMPNQALFMWHRMNVQKKSQKDAEKEYDDAVFNNKLDEEMDNFRTIVQQKDTQFYQDQKAKYESLLAERQNKVLKRQQELMDTILKDKSVLGGELKIKNVEVQEIYQDIVSGKVHQQLKDHNVMKEVAWFLKNREKFADTLKSTGANEAKLNLLNFLSNSKKATKGAPGEPPTSKPATSVDLDDWDY